MAKLLLIRGLPGSGKSTLAQQFVKLGYKHVEADMYFVNDGEYKFNAFHLTLAHDWCYSVTKYLLAQGHNVAVSNTFSQLWEMASYRALDADIQIIECQGEFECIHNVPVGTIERMLERWEYPYEEVRADNAK